MTTTLTQIQPCWVTSSHAALSSIEAAASHPVLRTRSRVALAGGQLPHGIREEAEVDDAPDAEGGPGGGDEGGGRGEGAARRLLDAGAEYADADEGADDAEDLGDDDRDAAHLVGRGQGGSRVVVSVGRSVIVEGSDSVAQLIAQLVNDPNRYPLSPRSRTDRQVTQPSTFSNSEMSTVVTS